MDPDSYIGQLRAVVGPRRLLMPGVRLVLMREDGAVLLQLRTDFRRWGLPGGTPEEGESLEACVVREAKEELDVELGELLPFGFSSDPSLETVQFPNGDCCQYFAMMFACPKFNGTPRIADDESLDLRWCTEDELPEPLMAATRPTLGAFQAWEESRHFQLLQFGSR